MTNVWCVRANGGMYAEHFVRGGYAAIGWREIMQDLGHVRTREELYDIFRRSYPDVSSTIVIGNYVGQIARFLLEIAAGDWVRTAAPTAIAAGCSGPPGGSGAVTFRCPSRTPSGRPSPCSPFRIETSSSSPSEGRRREHPSRTIRIAPCRSGCWSWTTRNSRSW